MMKTLVIFIGAFTLLNSVKCFNIDLNTHVEYKRPAETLFGFSVAAHREANTGW